MENYCLCKYKYCMNILIKLQKKKGWKVKKNRGYELWFKGYLNNGSINLLIKELTNINFDQKKTLSFFRNLDGHYSIILVKNNRLLVGGDLISSIPLMIIENKNKIIISDSYKNILNLSNIKKELNIDFFQAKHFAMTGYTFGENSLFKEIKITYPGTFYLFNRNKLLKIKYHSWTPYKKNKNKNSTHIKSNLKKINIKIIEKLISSCKNKCIVVPLSAGLDSRFILSGLVHMGYKNIRTFSYGIENNREKKVAKEISEYLNIPWTFIKFSNFNQKKIMQSENYKDFKEFSDATTSIHFPQDYQAIEYLKSNDIIPKDSIFVNGQTGDFISGNHIQIINKGTSINHIIDLYLKKNYKMWKSLLLNNKKIMLNVIKERIYSFRKTKVNSDFILEALQKIEYEDRQAKYLMAGQRNYEYLGFEWRLPLWDKEYINFWEKLDLKFKIRQDLYKSTLKEQNWSNVWYKYPLNPKNTFTLDVSLARLVFKCLHFVAGKENWHKFELRFLDYFMHPLCGYAPWTYSTIINDKRGFANALSWHVEEYLKEKGLNWKGERMR